MDLQNVDHSNRTQNKDGVKLILYIIKKNDPYMIHYFIKAGRLDVNLVHRGRRLVHLSAMYGSLQILKYLQLKGESLLTQDDTDDGYTPLHLAVLKRQEEVTLWLLKRGVPVNCVNRKGLTPLFCAIEFGFEHLVKILLNSNATTNISISNFDNATPLHIASWIGNKDIANLLMKGGSDNHVFSSNTHLTPFHWAAALGHLECLKLMFNFGVDMSVRTNDENNLHSIHLATIGGHVSVVKWLLEKDVHVDCKCRYSFTPLHLATNSSNFELVKLLISKNAEVNFRMKFGECNSPLDMAAFRGDIRVLTMLLEAGSDPNAKEETHGLTAMHYAIRSNNLECLAILHRYQGDMAVRSNLGETLLITAAKYNSADVAHWLIDSVKVNINQIDDHGLSPLHYTAMSRSPEVALTLLTEGADVDIISNDAYQMTPLHCATVRDYVDMIVLLLVFQADMHAQCSINLNPLHLATMKGEVKCLDAMASCGDLRTFTGNKQGDHLIHLASDFGNESVVYWLLENKMSVNTRNRLGCTALTNATRQGSYELVKLLLDNGADVNNKVIRMDNVTALHLACINGYLEIARLLIQRGIDIEAKTSVLEYRALHFAARKGWLETTELLLQHGARKDVRDRHGQTPRDLANDNGHEEIVNLLSGT